MKYKLNQRVYIPSMMDFGIISKIDRCWIFIKLDYEGDANKRVMVHEKRFDKYIELSKTSLRGRNYKQGVIK